ncbi:MAG: hypothetical protein R3A45_00880 [Bdellovibrionota bacterium]|nr:hypothetical protein [Deltaproteobacteria bacterium]
MARVILLLFIYLVGIQPAAAAARVVTALVHSAETYILDQNDRSIQEYGSGDTIYLVMDAKEKRAGFYRVTFDPTNLQGDGWVAEGKIRILSNYRSSDGKLPKNYEKKYVAQEKPLSKQSNEDLLSGEMTFIDELVSQEQDALETNIINDTAAAAPIKPAEGEVNPFEEDLEFLFIEDDDFKNTLETAKVEHKGKGVKEIGISEFSLSGDKFAQKLNEKFESQLNAKMKFNKVVHTAYVDDIDSLNQVTKVSIPKGVSGVFFGTLSAKVDKKRLFKIKYYDPSLKQFMFEKVVSLPLGSELDASINQLVTEVASFLRTQ